jgi:hypothetical protein
MVPDLSLADAKIRFVAVGSPGFQFQDSNRGTSLRGFTKTVASAVLFSKCELLLPKVG